MKVEKVGKHYRVRKMISGKSYCRTFDHNPTKREIQEAFRDVSNESKGLMDFETAANKYIEARADVLSPATVREYKGTLSRLSDRFVNLNINDIDQNIVQKEINSFAKTKSPKTVRNIHGFISSVLGEFRPSLILGTTLPQREVKKAYIPTDDDIKTILEKSKGTMMELPILLACCSLRRGEICALTMEDIDFSTGTIHISKDMVLDEHKKWVIKPPKTPESVRDIVVPNYVLAIIEERGLYTGHPNSISKWMNRVQDDLGMPRFSIHKCRHYFASKSHAKGIPDADIMAAGGWKTDYVMKNIYRHSLGDNAQKVSAAIFDDIL